MHVVSWPKYSQKLTLASAATLASEWQVYIKVPGCDRKGDPLAWWALNERSFPLLSRVARQLLAVPASSGSSERVFWRLGRVCAEDRVRMKAETADILTFIGFNCGL